MFNSRESGGRFPEKFLLSEVQFVFFCVFQTMNTFTNLRSMVRMGFADFSY